MILYLRMKKLVSKNPASGAILAELEMTSVSDLPQLFAKTREAQKTWAGLTPERRAFLLLQLREVVIRRSDELIELISNENGKPRFEALANEILPSVDLITFFAHHGPKILKNKKIPMRLMKHRASYLNYWPLGVVAVISPWNYPLLLAFGEIIMALIAGNGVIFKPSEATPLIGLKIQEFCEEAGLPHHLVQTLIGDGEIGAALIQQKPDKIFFTGSVATGKKIMAAAAEHLIPVNLELGGKDAMIVLADADIDFATSAALWGGYSNSGQVCASVERVIVHQSIADPFIALLREKLSKLRQGPPSQSVDLGALTYEKQKAIYRDQLSQAKQMGATFICGGEFSDDARFIQPTLITGSQIESLSVYTEETFGPVIALTTFKSISEAVEKANSSKYGLLASVMTRNIHLGEQVAKQLEAGTVTINEVTYTAGLSETPWGGVKQSGFGRTHSAHGLLEFVNVRHIHKPISRTLVFKSPWWFPYTPFQFAVFKHFLGVYRLHRTDKLRSLSMMLWNFVQMIKNEKRL